MKNRQHKEQTDLERAFLLVTKPAPKRLLLTAAERENRALVKECRRLIVSIKAHRNGEAI